MKIFKNKNTQYILFGAYLVILCYHLFLSEMWGRQNIIGYRYNASPLKEIMRYVKNIQSIGLPLVLLNILGNILAFIPFGIFLKTFLTGERRLLRTVLLGLIFSCTIEFIQLIAKVGICDIDDVILNTVGVLVGSLIKKNKINKNNKSIHKTKKTC